MNTIKGDKFWKGGIISRLAFLGWTNYELQTTNTPNPHKSPRPSN
jgi:hypothetical protein